jgi:hypothetical protein
MEIVLLDTIFSWITRKLHSYKDHVSPLAQKNWQDDAEIKNPWLANMVSKLGAMNCMKIYS